MATSDISRRNFTKVVVGSSVVGRTASAADSMPKRPLGKVGVQAGILGIGGGRVTDRNFDQSTANRFVAEAIDNGVNYVDTAHGYRQSEVLIGNALKGRRDQVFLVSKTRSPSRDAAMKDIEESLQRLQTDHIDCYHIHNFGRAERFPDVDEALSDKGVLGALREAKKQGKIKHIGCTSHMRAERVLSAFATGDIELFMCTLNFVERHIYGFEKKVLPEARRRGIAVIGMKVLGGGIDGDRSSRLGAPEDYQTTLRYVWGVPGVSVAIVGMRSLEQLHTALEAARRFQPLTGTEMAGVTERGLRIAAEWGPLRGPVA